MSVGDPPTNLLFAASDSLHFYGGNTANVVGYAKLAASAPQVFSAPIEDVMAIEPSAVGRAFFPGFFGSEAPSHEKAGPLGIVSVSGPLMQKAGWFWDGYDAILNRFAKAMADPGVKSVVLKLDTPGGMCAGLFETVDAMSAIAAESGKPVLAYAGEMAASAGYALASVASEIWLPKSGIVGSVGVIITLAEYSEQLAKSGVRVAVIATGKQKTDGHPALPLSDEVIGRFTQRANYLNGMFVGQVAQARGMTTSGVLGLEAGTFYGEDAVKAKLADHVGSYAEFLKHAESKTKVSPPRAASSARVAAEDRPMEDTNKTPADAGAVATLALIAVTIGMASSSSEREVQANVRALADDARELQRTTGKSTSAEALGTVKAWQVSHEALSGVQAELASLRLRDSDRELNALIESAKASGKITSDSLEATCRAIGATSPAQLRSLIETLPVVGGGATRSTATQEPERAVALTEEDHAVSQMLGLSSEDMAATRRADRARKAG